MDEAARRTVVTVGRRDQHPSQGAELGTRLEGHGTGLADAAITPVAAGRTAVHDRTVPRACDTIQGPAILRSRDPERTDPIAPTGAGGAA